MRGRFFNTTFVSIHAPAEEKEEDIKGQFMKDWRGYVTNFQEMVLK
jgi:hypothetical protein